MKSDTMIFLVVSGIAPVELSVVLQIAAFINNLLP